MKWWIVLALAFALSASPASADDCRSCGRYCQTYKEFVPGVKASWGYDAWITCLVDTLCKPPSIAHPELCIAAAHETWETAGSEHPHLNFYRTVSEEGLGYRDNYDSVNAFVWLPDPIWSNDTPFIDTAIAATNRWYYADGSMGEVDTYFNRESYVYEDLPSSRADATRGVVDQESIALHEIGHWLALDHSPTGCSSCVMDDEYLGARVHLGLGDVYGICELYGGTGVGDLRQLTVSPGNGYVDVDWEMYYDQPYEFELYASAAGEPFVHVYSLHASGDAFDYRDTEVVNDTEYTYLLWIDDGFSYRPTCTPTGSDPLARYSDVSCAEETNGIRVVWATSYEDATLQGFNVYRADVWDEIYTGDRCIGDLTKITDTVVAASGSAPSNYEFHDSAALHGRTYSYLIKARSSGGEEERCGPACNPCWRPYAPLCELDFDPYEPACTIVCPQGDGSGGDAPLRFVVTLRDSCGFPIETSDDFFVLAEPSAADDFELCCASQQSTVYSRWIMLPSAPTDQQGRAFVDIHWAGGCNADVEWTGILTGGLGEFPDALHTQVISPDYNADCVVDPVDFGHFAPLMGTQDWRGDFDCDGDVNPIDFGIFGDHYGHECGGTRTLPIPPELLAQLGIGSDGEPIPQSFSASSSTPNPFGHSTQISYSVPSGGVRMSIVVYDLSGRRIKTLVDQEKPPGDHVVVWDATDDRGHQVPSGVYFCRIEAPGYDAQRKMVLTK